MSSIARGLEEVRARIDRAARLAARLPETILLVAVSKTKPAGAIREAYEAGQRDFGENYAQELAEKADELSDLADIRWHFIGHLQSNKAKLVAPIASIIHTVDTPSLAHELGKRRHGPTPLRVLVEVNVSGDPKKHGVTPSALGAVLDAASAEASLKLCGLMTMPPHDEDETRRAFAGLAALREQHGGKARLPELSMGMSDDLELAVTAGATMVRVGSAIFGAR
jgi:pyridoxal phosphate enzyme (YggS family)